MNNKIEKGTNNSSHVNFEKNQSTKKNNNNVVAKNNKAVVTKKNNFTNKNQPNNSVNNKKKKPVHNQGNNMGDKVVSNFVKRNPKAMSINNNFKNKKNNDTIKVIPLGGMGEVGKNCYIYEYKNDIFIIDYGVLFPGNEHMGVDYIIPDFTYLKENEKRIKGLFVTHAHEDHIGGIPFLLKKVKIPGIYASRMAKLLIERKLKEHKLVASIKEINEHTKLKMGDVTIHTFHQTHSVPNSLGLFFESPLGNVATTGDFKVDFSPSGEKRTDFHKIAKLSQKGVLALMSDSTNSLKSGFSESSADIGENLKLLIKEAKGRILFTTFASHINRVQKIIEGCLENDRKICVLGRSMKNNIQIGMAGGYINVKPSNFIDLKEVKNYPPEKVCIISTGSQGEPLAALSRIANGQNPNISLSSDDTIVFASNPIPGNNYPIGKIIDQLYKTECNIILNTPHFKTHTSGHASKEEQKLMLSLFEPTNFLPIHGNYFMLLEHKKTALSMGFEDEKIFLMDNGDMTVFPFGEKPYIKKKAVSGKSIYISGNNINVGLEDSKVHKLATDGILIITYLSDNERLVSYPQITTRGFIVINQEIDFLRQLQKYSIKVLKEQKMKNDKKISQLIRGFIYNKTGKNPLIRLNKIEFKKQNAHVKKASNETN